MKNKRLAVCFILVFVVALFASCSNATAETIIEMELTESYDTGDPFINEKLIYVSDTVDTLDLDIAFQMNGDSGTLEIADNETGQVFWSDAWSGEVNKTAFAVSLDSLEKEREYVVRFTGTGIQYAKIVISSDNPLVKERERPLKPNKVPASQNITG